MKTWTSALLHIGLAGAQVATSVPYFDNTHPNGILGNGLAQIGAQLGLTLLQAYVAKKNSNSDPNGNKLVQNVNGGYTTDTSVKIASGGGLQ